MKLKKITFLTIWKEPPFAAFLIGAVITISTAWWRDKNWPMFSLWIAGETIMTGGMIWATLRLSRLKKTIKAHEPSLSFWRNECQKALDSRLVAGANDDRREVELAEARFKIALARYKNEIEKAYAPYFEDKPGNDSR